MYFSSAQAKYCNYVCASIAIVILLARLLESTVQRKRVDASFVLVAVSVFLVVVRLVVNYYYLKFGTASDALSNAHYFNTHDPQTIEAGTILSLFSRVLITLICWIQIGLLLFFYRRMMYMIKWVGKAITVCWILLATTFTAVVLAIFLECRPFHLYWQLSPNPGTCVKGYTQLLIQCISNVVINILLLVIAYPLLVHKGRSMAQYCRLAALLMLGIFCITVACLRLTAVFATGSAQTARSFWASIQMAVAVFVANVPTIYGDIHASRRKKQELLGRRASTAETWRSDSMAHAACLEVPSPSLTKTSISDMRHSDAKEWFDRVDDDV